MIDDEDVQTAAAGSYRRMVRQHALADTTLSVYDTSHPDNQLPDNQLDSEGGRWVVVCEEHDLYINVATEAEARAALEHPEQVCDECAAAMNARLVPPVPVGALRSPDGTQWWDGKTWRPVADPIPMDAVRSPDGTEWWDGETWRPVSCDTSQSKSIQPSCVSTEIHGSERPPFAVGAVMAALGALALIIGSLLPWASATTVFGALGRSGVEGGDGWGFIAGAAMIISVAAYAISGVAKVGIGVAILLLGATAGAWIGYEIWDINQIGQRGQRDIQWAIHRFARSGLVRNRIGDCSHPNRRPT